MVRTTKKNDAPTTTETAGPKKERKQRTPEEIVADLEAKIAATKARAAARKAKRSPENQALLSAVRALDKAMIAAEEAGSELNLRALQAAHAPLGELLVSMGLRFPKARARRTKGEAA